MSLFSFLKSRKFFIHFGLALITVVVILLLSFFSINLYTHHGEAISVPDFSGLTFDQAKRMADDKDFKVEISDSVHFQDKEKGTVVSQVPEPNNRVKTGRTIYLIVNGMEPEMVQMPDLTGIKVEDAKTILTKIGLKIEINGSGYIYKQSVGKNALVKKGSNVIVTAKDKSLETNQTVAPALVGLRLPDALRLAESSGFILNYTGNGEIIEQDVKAGTIILKNSTIIVRLGA